jgi:Asp-tRNA(Asn)/Glu-tRNA(Gln) amidotransferase A subunit family amidase
MLARIERLNPKLNAYITVTAEVALAQAKRAEAELYAPRGRRGIAIAVRFMASLFR